MYKVEPFRVAAADYSIRYPSHHPASSVVRLKGKAAIRILYDT